MQAQRSLRYELSLHFDPEVVRLVKNPALQAAVCTFILPQAALVPRLHTVMKIPPFQADKLRFFFEYYYKISTKKSENNSLFSQIIYLLPKGLSRSIIRRRHYPMEIQKLPLNTPIALLNPSGFLPPAVAKCFCPPPPP